MKQLRVGDLFSGIGGFSLGLERAGGFKTQWFVEIDPYCQRVLAKHWPHVPRYGDIKAIDWGAVPRVDVLCGGFPCQDISLAGKGAGLTGERSGLWFEYAKAIEVLKPCYVLIENVSALRARGLDQVLGALAALGYDAEWHCIPAYAVGVPHRRDRVWVVAYAASEGPQRHRAEYGLGESRQKVEIGGGGDDVADSSIEQWDRWLHWTCGWEREPQEALRDARERGRQEAWMSVPESLLGRVAHGVPHRVDRLRGLGNAIVPQIAEWIGRQIMKANPTKGARDE